MATTKKIGIVAKVKNAISGLFTSGTAAGKSPERVAAGNKAAATTSAKKTVAASQNSAKKVVKAVKPAKTAARKKSRR